MSNFVPNETKRFVLRDPPWITKYLKSMLNRKNRIYKSCKTQGYRYEDNVRLDTFHIECQQAVENPKLSYLTNLGNKVNDPNTSQKTYWKIINKVVIKCRAPEIPPLLVNNLLFRFVEKKQDILTTVFQNNVRLLLITVCHPLLAFLQIRGIHHVIMKN